MSRYGTTIFGTDTYGEYLSTGLVAFDFKAVSSNYGEVTVSWREPAGTYNRQRLVFNPSGPSVHESDGQVLYDRSSADADYHQVRFVHSGVTQGRFFNYALWVYDNTGLVWVRAGSDEVLTTKNHGYTRRLYDNTPEVYKSADLQALGNSHYDDEQSFLYKFLSVIGLELDTTRTELETLRTTANVNKVASVVLPALGQQYGVSFEPQISGRSMRRLIATATHLYAIKGTARAMRLLADVVTGWPSTVTIGKNIALDMLDAGPVGGRGRWTTTTPSAVSVDYHAADSQHAGAFRSGVLDVHFIGPASLGTLTTRQGDGVDRVRSAIPILAGTTYTVSQHLQDAGTLTDGRAGAVWLSVLGEVVGTTSYGALAQLGAGLTRVSCSAAAPVGARYLEPLVEVSNHGGGNVAADTHVYASGLQVEAAVAATSWEPARQVHLRMTVDRPTDVPAKSHRLALLLKDFIVPGGSVALEFVQ